MTSVSDTNPGRKRRLGAVAVLCTTCASSIIGLSGSASAAPEQSVLDKVRSTQATTAPVAADAMAARGDALPQPLPPEALPIGVRIVAAAASKAGSPYSYGSTGPSSFDCSGLTQFSYRAAGIEIPRTSAQQAAAARPIPREQALPGDLVFFGSGGGVSHAAIYAGPGMMWTAPQSGDVVKLQQIYSSNYSIGRLW